MQALIDYNFLIIGRSGSGKSATSKLLTGDPSIAVANSLNEVTKSVKFYRGIEHSIDQEHVRFGILDIPGLDRIENRFTIRECILQQLERLKISLHGILYVASLTERDTVDQTKLFSFIDQLPWAAEAKRASLLPILTKYDNFVFDSPDEDIDRTKDEFHRMFNERGHGQAWSKRVYWVNFTKSLEFKMKVHEDIREKHESQIDRLTAMVRKNKKPLLTAQAIREYIEKEQAYVLRSFMAKISSEEIPHSHLSKVHQIPLHIKLHSNRLAEGFTAVSASSIGIIISRALKADIPVPLSLAMMGIPISLVLVNLLKPTQEAPDKLGMYGVERSQHKLLDRFRGVCKKINMEIEEEWKNINNNIQFGFDGKTLKCSFDPLVKYNFFTLDQFAIYQEAADGPEPFERVFTGNEHKCCFQVYAPRLPEGAAFWDPIIEIHYQVKMFDEGAAMAAIEALRQEYNAL